MRKNSSLIIILSFALGVIFSFEAVRAASNNYNRKSVAQENISRCWCHVTTLIEAYEKKEMEVQEMVKEAAQTAETMENLALKAFALSKIAAGLNQVNRVKANQIIDRAIETANQIYSASYRNSATDLKETVRLWEEEDQEKILTLMERMENTVSRTWLLRIIAADAMAIDKAKGEKIFERAIEKTEMIRNQQHRDLDLRALAGEIAKLDTEKALQIAAKIKDPKIKIWALRAIASEVAKYNQAGALKIWEIAIAEVEKITEIEGDKGMASIPEEIKQRLLLYENAKKGATRALILSKIALEISGIDKEIGASLFNRAVEMAEEIEKPYTKSFTLSNIAGALLQVDIAEAARVAEMIDRQYADARFSALMGIASRTYAQEDLEKAATAAEEIEEPYDKAKALSRVATAMGQLNKDKALKLIDQIKYPYTYSEALSSIAVEWPENDEKKVLELVKNIEDPFIRSKTLKEIGVLMSRSDKRKAERLFSKAVSIAEEIKSTFLLGDIIAEWTKISDDKLLDLVQKIEGDEYHRAMALREIALDWSRSNTPKAEMILDMAVNSAEKIDDTYTQSELLTEIAVAWAKIDGAKAETIFRKALEAIEKLKIIS